LVAVIVLSVLAVALLIYMAPLFMAFAKAVIGYAARFLQ